MSFWDTIGEVAPWVINPFVAASVAQADAGYRAAGGKALTGGSAPPPAASTTSTDAGDDAYIKQLMANQNGYLYGSPNEQGHYNEYQQGLSAFGLSPDTVITRNGQPLVQPVEQPGAIAGANRRDQELLNQAQGYVNDFQNTSGGIYNDLQGTFSGLNASDQALIDSLKSSYAGNVLPESAAAQAYADPASIAAENQALAALTGAANGSLNVSTNPADLARQQQSYDQLQAAAGGSLDAFTNPEDLARQRQASEKLWGLTDPEMTAQERFLMEKFRQEEEHGRQAAMDAALRNLSARGQLGSGGEIGAMLGAQQTTSQNRMLQDLGAQANAVTRSQNALGLYSDLATQMRNASDAMTSGNMNRREGAMEGAGTMATNMRNASDALSTANANRQEGAMEGAGTLSSNMRGQSFDESYKRGSATDQRNQFDATRKDNQATNIANTGIGANQAAGGRAGSLATLGSNNAGNVLTAQTGLTGAKINANNNELNRGLLGVQMNNDLLLKAWAADQQRQAEAALAQPQPGFIDKLLPWNW
jgi:hypothetical protein